MIPRHATLDDELWLRRFVTCFLGELIFGHGQLAIAVEVAEVGLAVVTRQIDLAPVILVETFCRLDKVSHCCRHFHGCAGMVQVNCPSKLSRWLNLFLLC